MDRTLFRQLLITHFNIEEFKDLCFDLDSVGVAYDNLAGEGLGAKARELILFCERANLTPLLLEACRKARPRVVWDSSTAALPGNPPGVSTTPPFVTPLSQPSPVLPTGAFRPPVSPVETSHDPLDAHFTMLIRAAIEGRLVPFLGTDVNLCGRPPDVSWVPGQYFPSTREVAAYLSHKLAEKGYPPDEAHNLVSVSEQAALRAGEGDLYDHLRQLYAAHYPPTLLHQTLAMWPGLLRQKGYASYPIIVTTNYDDSLERAFQAQNEAYDVLSYMARGSHRGRLIHATFEGDSRVIEKPNEYGLLPIDQRTIIVKIHGDVHPLDAERDSYVITEDDYISFMSRTDIANVAPATLVSRVRKNHFLFLGYNLRDWNRRVVLQRLWDDQKLLYRSWAVPMDPQALDEAFWRKRDVEMIHTVSLEDYMSRFAARLAALPPLGS
jgi:hypothetical protein